MAFAKSRWQRWIFCDCLLRLRETIQRNVFLLALRLSFAVGNTYLCKGPMCVAVVCVSSVKVTCLCEKLHRELYGIKKRELFSLAGGGSEYLILCNPRYVFSECVLLQKMQESAKCCKI